MGSAARGLAATITFIGRTKVLGDRRILRNVSSVQSAYLLVFLFYTLVSRSALWLTLNNYLDP